jgi:hypothetical protein
MTPPPPRTTVPGWDDELPDVPPATKAYLHSIGDIGVTKTLVVTPTGTCALRDSVWRLVDHTEVRSTTTRRYEKLVTRFARRAPMGRLLRLVLEPVKSGYFEVSVDGGAIAHAVRVPINDVAAALATQAEFTHIQELAQSAGESGKS